MWFDNGLRFPENRLEKEGDWTFVSQLVPYKNVPTFFSTSMGNHQFCQIYFYCKLLTDNLIFMKSGFFLNILSIRMESCLQKIFNIFKLIFLEDNIWQDQVLIPPKKLECIEQFELQFCVAIFRQECWSCNKKWIAIFFSFSVWRKYVKFSATNLIKKTLNGPFIITLVCWKKDWQLFSYMDKHLFYKKECQRNSMQYRLFYREGVQIKI